MRSVAPSKAQRVTNQWMAPNTTPITTTAIQMESWVDVAVPAADRGESPQHQDREQAAAQADQRGQRIQALPPDDGDPRRSQTRGFGLAQGGQAVAQPALLRRDAGPGCGRHWRPPPCGA